MFRLLSLSTILLLAALSLNTASADDDPNHYTVTKYYVRVIGQAGRVDEEFGPFPDSKSAEDAALRWSKARPNDYRLPMVAEVEVKIPLRRPGQPRPQEPATMPATPRPGGGGAGAGADKLKGTTWVGSESATDTTSLKFEFAADGTVRAYDDSASVWSGTWRMVGTGTVVIQLTSPSKVNYSGQLVGNRLSGKAGRSDSRGQWNFSVELQAPPAPAFDAPAPAFDAPAADRPERPALRPPQPAPASEKSEYILVTEGTEEHLHTRTPYPTREWALERAREGWNVWRNRADMTACYVVDSSGRELVRYAK